MSDFRDSLLNTRSGRQLYELLPEVYRSRDLQENSNNIAQRGDLARFLDGMGELLDATKALLDQRLADAFPDNPERGLACQEWLVPYFAQLVNAKLLSPTAAGKRDEVTQAVRWRQSKGTLVVAEQIAEAVGQFEAELHEGWKRVAMTARSDLPLTSSVLLGYQEALFPETALRNHPRHLARHPGLVSSVVDLRWQSRAIVSSSKNPAARQSKFAGRETVWRQLNPAGAPANANTFDDTSRRTVDFRKPNWQHGHFHPRRLLVHVPIPNGLVPMPTKYVEVTSRLADFLKVTVNQVGESYHLEISPISNHPVVLNRDLQLPGDLPDLLADLDASTRDEVIDTGIGQYSFYDVQTNQTLQMDSGTSTFVNCKINQLDINANVLGEPVAILSDSLIGTAEINGIVGCDCCTFLANLRCDGLNVTESIFNSDIINFLDQRPQVVADFCRIDSTLAAELSSIEGSLLTNIVHELPIFLSPTFNGAGEGVLAPTCPKTIYQGASDNGELGFRKRLKPTAQVITGTHSFTLPEDYDYPLRNLVFTETVTVTSDSLATLSLEQVVIQSLTVMTPRLNKPEIDGDASGEHPVLNAIHCLFETLAMNLGVARMEYCTLLQAYSHTHPNDDPSLRLQASDCIFASDNFAEIATRDCVRYSRVPSYLMDSLVSGNSIRFPNCTSEIPNFFSPSIADALDGEIGCGVLHPSTPDSLCFGAEDGGEIGVHHDWYFCLKNHAVITKLIDHLPMGIQPVLIPDAQLNQYPLGLCHVAT